MTVNQSFLEAVAGVAERFVTAGPPTPDQHQEIAAAVREATRGAPAASLFAAAEHFRDRPEIALPLLEDVVHAEPNNSRALVRLANCYWLVGAGPRPVAELASRAIAIDPNERGAWHLWALTEEQPRERVARWQQVATRFPQDNLALANVADNAASVASAERDYEMIDIAIGAFEQLRARAQRDEERAAVERALETLRAWRF